MNQASTSSKDNVIQNEQQLIDAMKHGNLEILDKLIHEDLLFIIPSGEVITKAMDMKAYRSKNMNITSITASEQTVSVVGDTTIVSVTIEMKGIYLGQPLDGTYKYLRVWRLFDSLWKVIAGSCTPL